MDYRVEMTNAEAELQETLEISSFSLHTKKNPFHSFSVVTSLILPEAGFQVAPTEWSSSQQEEALPLGSHLPLWWLSPIAHLSLLETSASASCQPCTVGQQFGPLRFSPFRIKYALDFQSSHISWLPDPLGCSIPITFACNKFDSTVHLRA